MPQLRPKDIWLYIYERKEIRTNELKKVFVSSAKGSSFKVSHGTFYKWLKELLLEGKIEQKPNNILKVFPYSVPKKHHEYLKKLSKIRNFQIKIEKLPIEDTIKIIERLENELRLLQRELRIQELMESNFPLSALEARFGKNAREEYHGWFTDFSNYPADLIEVKTVSYEEYERYYSLGIWKTIKRNLVQSEPKTWKTGKISFTTHDVTGTVVIGVWKELLDLIEEETSEKMISLKEQFEVSDETWGTIKEDIYEMIKHEMGDSYIYRFIESVRTPSP